MRKKRLFGWLAVGGAAAIAAQLLAPASAPERAQTVQPPPQTVAPADKSSFAALPSRQPFAKSSVDLFSPRHTATPKPAPAPVTAEAPAPTPPPMPYRIAGQVVHDQKAQVVLARGDRVITVKPGDVLEGGYRVESIDANAVILVYTPLGIAEQLSIPSRLVAEAPRASARAALAAEQVAAKARRPQFRWQGPERVFAGTTFEVALKVTSPQAIRFSPLEVSYDAKLLEAVGVRGGDFLAEGEFRYRVSPNGAILIGASETHAVATDVDFLVVTFKPLQPATAAELKLNSLVLRGPAGEATAYDAPAVFRTTIVR